MGNSSKTLVGNGSNGSYLLENLTEHKDSVNCMRIADDESVLVTGSDDKTVCMWDVKGKKTECLGTLR